MTSEWLRPVDDASFRCWWPGDDVQYQDYHDTEWGRPVRDDQRLFEKMCLEGFQSGLSWLTILRKRENFRAAFDNFDFHKVALYSDVDVNRLLADAGIVRHRGKIEAVINNALRAQELIHELGSLTDFIWSYAPDTPFGRDGESGHPSGLATTSPSAVRLSKDLKKRGWKFVGPTTMYSFMQSMGLVNDHVDGCWVQHECEQLRRKHTNS
ncbi:MAG: DNA-3-methyladenine glycosylase I [Acidimicrobiaceae bacterium]|jgi:DNA-3-methyladenine glycosylase I|nr:DNA-3-methyladenine glycosylase I [Ilumatobacteraceae bacterium]